MASDSRSKKRSGILYSARYWPIIKVNHIVWISFSNFQIISHMPILDCASVWSSEACWNLNFCTDHADLIFAWHIRGTMSEEQHLYSKNYISYMMENLICRRRCEALFHGYQANQLMSRISYHNRKQMLQNATEYTCNYSLMCFPNAMQTASICIVYFQIFHHTLPYIQIFLAQPGACMRVWFLQEKAVPGQLRTYLIALVSKL